LPTGTKTCGACGTLLEMLAKNGAAAAVPFYIAQLELRRADSGATNAVVACHSYLCWLHDFVCPAAAQLHAGRPFDANLHMPESKLPRHFVVLCAITIQGVLCKLGRELAKMTVHMHACFHRAFLEDRADLRITNLWRKVQARFLDVGTEYRREVQRIVVVKCEPIWKTRGKPGVRL